MPRILNGRSGRGRGRGRGRGGGNYIAVRAEGQADESSEAKEQVRTSTTVEDCGVGMAPFSSAPLSSMK